MDAFTRKDALDAFAAARPATRGATREESARGEKVMEAIVMLLMF
jgi:hypothetical protein